MAYQLLDVDLGGGSVLQYANRDPYQMMGYLLKTPEGKTVMIDGGRWEGADAAYLHELILKEGGRVDLWLITHAHDDHFSALSCILRDNDRLDFEIGDMRICFPPLEWLKTVEHGNGYGPAAAFLERLQKHSIETTQLRRGDVLTCGGLTIDVLHDCENYVNYNNINDTGAVLRVHYPNRDILFLADIDVQAAKELMELYPRSSCSATSFSWPTTARMAPTGNFMRSCGRRLPCTPPPCGCGPITTALAPLRRWKPGSGCGIWALFSAVPIAMATIFWYNL